MVMDDGAEARVVAHYQRPEHVKAPGPVQVLDPHTGQLVNADAVRAHGPWGGGEGRGGAGPVWCTTLAVFRIWGYSGGGRAIEILSHHFLRLSRLPDTIFAAAPHRENDPEIRSSTVLIPPLWCRLRARARGLHPKAPPPGMPPHSSCAGR